MIINNFPRWRELQARAYHSPPQPAKQCKIN